MRATPGSGVELVVDWGSTGATIGVRLLDNDGNTTIARMEGFLEDPSGSGVYRFDGDYTVPDESGTYTLLYDDDAGVAAINHVAVEELIVSSAAPDDVIPGVTYASRDELQRILKIRTPSTEQEDAMDRVLLAATKEINDEIGITEDEMVDLSQGELAVAHTVNLDRAVEHWRQQEAPFGIVGLGAELGPAIIGRDTWDRHAHKLAHMKRSWGLA
jgi:hypothetical protein